MTEYTKTKNTPSGIWEKAREATRKLGDWYILKAGPEIPLLASVRQVKQVHGGNIVRSGELEGGKKESDGILVTEAGVSCAITTADCLPLVIIGQQGAMALHLSRKTLVRGLLDNVLTFMETGEMDHIYIGPHICQMHLNFEEEGKLLRLFRYRYPEAVHFHSGKIYISLIKAVKQILREWEIHPDKITEDKRCTYESLDLPSYRRRLQGGKEGKVGAISTVIWK